MATSVQSRALIACCLLACCFTGFSARLVQIQVGQHEKYTKQALGNYGSRTTITARRGSIQDVHGLPLAQNEPVKTVVADASLIKDAPKVAQLLAGPLGMPARDILEKLSRTHARWNEEKKAEEQAPLQYMVLKREVPESTATEISKLMAEAKQRGIHFEQDFIRVYPNNEMLCHVVESINNKGVGVEGVERSMQQYLAGQDGFRYTERTRTGQEMVAFRGEERPARDGGTVQLTIDAALQMIVETEMDAAMAQYKPKMAVCVLMRPQTGEILALANRPNFNLNQIVGVNPEFRKNAAVMSMVEPGSTFMIVTTAAALTQKLVRPDTMIFCENGRFTYAGKPLRDSHPLGEISVADILVHSSNIGVAKLALQLGDQRLYEYVRKFGFGERTGVQLPSEISGLVHPPHRWSKISITRVPMGQEVAATPIQIVTAMSAIANGGRLLMPQIIHEVRDGNGKLVAAYPPQEIRRAIPENIATEVRLALQDVTTKRGTANGAAVPGFKVAGKTGTAQKVGPNGTYESGKYVVSFVGFMPAEKPEFACLVMLDDAVTQPGLNYGGLVAAPIFKKIAERIVRHLDLPITNPEDPALIPTLPNGRPGITTSISTKNLAGAPPVAQKD